MSTLFLSLFLIVFVLFIVTLRIFIPKMYTKYQKYDSLAILPVITVITSFLLINAYGLTVSIIIAISLSLIVFLTNLRRFYNLCIGLDKDSYSPGFIIISILQSIVIFVFFVLILIYLPPLLKTEKPSSMIFYGSHKAGYFEKTSIFEKTTAKLDIYQAVFEEEETSTSVTEESEITTEETNSEEIIQETEKAEEQIVEKEKPTPKNVIYLSDVFVTTQDAQGTLSYLADKGYNVFAFSFFDKLNYFNNFKDSHSFSPFFMRYAYKNQDENISNKKEKFILIKLCV